MSLKNIGNVISELRKNKGVKQEELANAVGVSTQAVSKWENGGTPDTELLPADCGLLQRINRQAVRQKHRRLQRY